MFIPIIMCDSPKAGGGHNGQKVLPTIKKAVVICPSSLVATWRKEIEKWLGSERLQPIEVKSGAGAVQQIRDFRAGKTKANSLM